MEQPLVSVCIQAYQHVHFIRETIESVLMQETDFPIEILIGEDESTDGTREICIEYEKKHPDLIRLFLNERRNVIYIDGKPTGRWNFINNMEHARGKYVALLPGDDYWTYSLKLQKQVEFMEQHPDYAFCFHNADRIDGNGNNLDDPFCNINMETRDVSMHEFFERNLNPNCSAVYRKSALFPLSYARNIRAYDWFLNILAGEKGKIRYFKENWSVIRNHRGGVWQSMQVTNRLEAECRVLKNINIYFNRKYHEYILPSTIIRKSQLADFYLRDRKLIKYLHSYLTVLFLRLFK